MFTGVRRVLSVFFLNLNGHLSLNKAQARFNGDSVIGHSCRSLQCSPRASSAVKDSTVRSRNATEQYYTYRPPNSYLIEILLFIATLVLCFFWPGSRNCLSLLHNTKVLNKDEHFKAKACHS